MDSARGSKCRAQYIREAIYRMLVEQGRDLPESIAQAPDRAGKGGRKKKASASPPEPGTRNPEPD